MIHSKTFCSTLTTFEAPFNLAGVPIGNRMTVITCPNNKVWIHSPVLLTQDMIDHLNELGEVCWAVCPNLFHYLHAYKFLEHFPDCQLFGVSGIQIKEKRCSFHSLEESVQLWVSEIQQYQIQGIPKIKEVVFFHPNSKTLILTDLLFNCSHTSLWAKLLMTLNGAHNKCTTTRVYKSMIQDKEQFKTSIEHILKWDFERVILAHGSIIEKDAKAILTESFSWL